MKKCLLGERGGEVSRDRALSKGKDDDNEKEEAGEERER